MQVGNKEKDSFPAFWDISIPGSSALRAFPKWGTPVLWIRWGWVIILNFAHKCKKLSRVERTIHYFCRRMRYIFTLIPSGSISPTLLRSCSSFPSSSSPLWVRRLIYNFSISLPLGKDRQILCGLMEGKLSEPDLKASTSFVEYQLVGYHAHLAVFPMPYCLLVKKLTKLPLFSYFTSAIFLWIVPATAAESSLTNWQRPEWMKAWGLCLSRGLSTEEETLAPFKNGAFKLSCKGVTIVSRFSRRQRLLPYDNFRGRPGLLKVDVLPFLHPQDDSQEEIERLRTECYDGIWPV